MSSFNAGSVSPRQAALHITTDGFGHGMDHHLRLLKAWLSYVKKEAIACFTELEVAESHGSNPFLARGEWEKQTRHKNVR